MDPGALREAFERVVRAPQPWRAPTSTYRIQFNQDFRFQNAKDIADYLHALGITDIYSSPYFKARSGSTHGYDVTDPTSLNPELGSEEDFGSFTNRLKEYDMGLIMDVVPNHMGVAVGENVWWTDVLENGHSSPYARYFDIDWHPVREGLEGKVLLPMLGGQYGDVLEGGDLRLAFKSGAFFVSYYEHHFPLDPSTYAMILDPCAQGLVESLGESDAAYLELMSVVTAIRNLPSRDESDPERIAERMREKEVIKRRLQSLFEDSQDFRVQLQEALHLLNGIPGEPKSFDALDALLNAQPYRLSFWQVATEEINYRRFFDINDLAAIHTEDPAVFGHAHGMLLRHVAEGKITGLRIDHPDGLHDPRAYFTRLQEECFVHLCAGLAGTDITDSASMEELRVMWQEICADSPSHNMPFYIVGEKILMESERLPDDWPIYGTTGYSFMNSSGGVLVNSLNARVFDAVYTRFVREKQNFAQMAYEKKRLILETSMAGETNVLGHQLNRISEGHRRYRDFTLNSLTDAIIETIACFPVYRTYFSVDEVPERDIRYVENAINRARRFRQDIAPSVFDFLRDVLTLRYPDWADEGYRALWLEFAMKFQQMTGPVMAKGIEDTVFYCYNRLISLNEVGGHPSTFGLRTEAFHGQNIERSKRWPLTMVATSTHDAKRSEDVRARLHVLSELPYEWREQLKQWSGIARKFKVSLHGKRVPDRPDEYLLYQTLLGAWPHGDAGPEEMAEFNERIKQYMLKAARESKRNTNWINPDTDYEAALLKFTERLIGSPVFKERFIPFQRKLSFYGMFNSLAMTLLKVTVPGVSDFYQGTELWSLTLVDPDNRSPVDYDLRRRMLEELDRREAQDGQLELVRDLLTNPEDGRIKLYVASRALRIRRENRELFESGEYLPVYAQGTFDRNIVAFERRREGRSFLCVLPRLLTSIVEPGIIPVGRVWDDTVLPFGTENEVRRFRDVFTGRELMTTDHEGVQALAAASIFESFPLGLLEDVSDGRPLII